MFSKDLFIGTYSNKESEGIYQLKNNQIELFARVDNPTYLTKDEKYIYTYFSNKDEVGLLILDYQGNEIQRVISPEKKGPCFITKHPHKNIIYTCNYHDHIIVEYSMIDDEYFLTKTWNTNNADSHLHHIYFSHDAKHLYVCDLGLDKVYYLDSQALTLIDECEFPKGSGPRHMVSTKNHQYYYVFTELSTEVYVYENSIHTSNLIQTIRTTKHDSVKSGAAIRISNDDRFLYVSNRGEDTLVVFEIHDGLLEFVQRIDCGGQHPRDFNIIDNKYLVCANRDSNNLCVFKRVSANGELEYLESLQCYQPVSIL